MAEISREDAIKVLSTYNCVDCGCGSSQVPTTQCKWDCNYKYSVIKAISDMEKLEKIEQIIKKYDLQDITRDDVDDIVSGFEYEIIMAVLGKDIEV